MAMRPFAFSALLLLALAGCGIPDPPSDLVAEGTAKPDASKPEVKTPEETKPVEPAKPAEPEKPPVETAASLGIKVTDSNVGTGQAAEPGDTLYMLYTGKLTDGKVFDSTSKHGNKPFSFPLGMGQVIKGWDVGIVGMKAGGKRTLYIPSKHGYGVSGSGDSIPPNADLVFDVELLYVLKKADEQIVVREEVKPGTGAAVKNGDRIAIKYKGTLIDGTEFDSSEKNGGKPLEFKVGLGEVIPGFDLGVLGMKKGGVRKIVIPPLLGYGPQERGPIPANAVLKFEITLVDIK